MSLAYKAVLGALWTITSSVGGRAVGLVANIVLAALLTPKEYGEANVAVIIVHTVNMLTYLGFGQYLVANPRAGKDVAFHATVYHVLIGWAALGLTVLFSAPLASLYDAPSVSLYITGIAMAIALDRISFIPGRILAREMRFKVLGLKQMCGEFTYAGCAVGLALAGWGAKAIIAANVARALVACAILVGNVDRREWLTVHKLRLATTKELVRFGFPISVGNILHFGSAKWDNLVVAKIFGTGIVGQYNFAYNIADIPAAQVGEHIGDVLLPSFAKLENDEARKRALARAAGLLALIVFPLAIGLGSVAVTLRRAFLKPEWHLVGSMLALLSVLSVVRPVGWLISSYLQATLRPWIIMMLESLKLGALLGFVALFGTLYGPLAACLAVGLAFGTHALASIAVLKVKDGIPMGALLFPLARPFLACMPMAAAVVGLRLGAGTVDWNPWLALGSEIAVGAAGYLVAAFLIAGKQSRELISLLRGALRRKKPAEDTPA